MGAFKSDKFISFQRTSYLPLRRAADPFSVPISWSGIPQAFLVLWISTCFLIVSGLFYANSGGVRDRGIILIAVKRVTIEGNRVTGIRCCIGVLPRAVFLFHALAITCELSFLFKANSEKRHMSQLADRMCVCKLDLWYQLTSMGYDLTVRRK